MTAKVSPSAGFAWHHGKSDMTERLGYNQIVPNGAKALGAVYGYVMQSRLPAELWACTH
jgi:hypothetical protein